MGQSNFGQCDGLSEVQQKDNCVNLFTFLKDRIVRGVNVTLDDVMKMADWSPCLFCGMF